MHFSFGSFQLKGIALAAIAAILLNLFLPEDKQDKRDFSGGYLR